MSIQRSQSFGNTLSKHEILTELHGEFLDGDELLEPDFDSQVRELIEVASKKYQIRISRLQAEELILENMGTPAKRIAGDVWFAMEQFAEQALYDGPGLRRS